MLGRSLRAPTLAVPSGRPCPEILERPHDEEANGIRGLSALPVPLVRAKADADGLGDLSLSAESALQGLEGFSFDPHVQKRTPDCRKESTPIRQFYSGRQRANLAYFYVGNCANLSYLFLANATPTRSLRPNGSRAERTLRELEAGRGTGGRRREADEPPGMTRLRPGRRGGEDAEQGRGGGRAKSKIKTSGRHRPERAAGERRRTAQAGPEAPLKPAGAGSAGRPRVYRLST